MLNPKQVIDNIIPKTSITIFACFEIIGSTRAEAKNTWPIAVLISESLSNFIDVNFITL